MEAQEMIKVPKLRHITKYVEHYDELEESVISESVRTGSEPSSSSDSSSSNSKFESSSSNSSELFNKRRSVKFSIK